MDISVGSGSKNQKTFETQVQFVRGTNYQFKLKCRLPIIGGVTVGQNQFPWMVTANKNVLEGVKNPVKDRNPLRLANPKSLANLRIMTGLVGSLDLAPDTLDQWVALEDKKSSDGNQAICIMAKEKYPGSVTVSFQKDGKTPARIFFAASGVTGKAVIRDWKLNAVADDKTFDAPNDLKVVEMEQADLYRMFASFFNLAMQQAH
jgi:hypothetical protein